MQLIDWLLVFISLFAVAIVALRSRQYVKGVADFLTGGRIANRYVICVTSCMANQSVVAVLGVFELYYQSGFVCVFWAQLAMVVFVLLALTGYCSYRFRETRAMTMGQFLEMRYSRKFRIFSGLLQAVSGILQYGIFPAVWSRFIVYFCGFPEHLDIGSMVFPTFAVIMAVFLFILVLIVTLGGQITNMTTTCIQRVMCYPMLLIVVLYIFVKFNWFNDIAPALLGRPHGKSLINPFDSGDLRDFNLFWIVAGILGNIVNRISWCNTQGYNVAAKDAHEQKMAGVLTSWANVIDIMVFIVLALSAFAFLNSDKFQGGPKGAAACRSELAAKAARDVMASEKLAPVRQEILKYIDTGQVSGDFQKLLDKTAEMKKQEAAVRERIRYVSTEQAPSTSQSPGQQQDEQNAREYRIQVAQDAIHAIDPAASQTFATVFGQMRVPMAIRYILPAGILGIFLTICVFLILAADTSCLHSWGSIMVQDIILPLRKDPFTPNQQLALLRLLVSCVAVFAFFFSYFFGQVDYILMFFTIAGAIWLGGSGPCIVGGLYWKRGTTAAAWTALLTGSSLAIAGILAQKYWVTSIYPWLYKTNMVDTVAIWLRTASTPFEPVIKWRMSSEKFPINSMELYIINMLISILLYVIVSLLTCREPFNMERMLHRGKYHREGTRLETEPITIRNLIPHLVGIDNQYTRPDKILAWSVFFYQFVWSLGIGFIGVMTWNMLSPWGSQAWSVWFVINNIAVAGIVGAIAALLLTIAGSIGLTRLFKDLASSREKNILDDGRVIGRVSADDLMLLEKAHQISVKNEHAEAKNSETNFPLDQ